MVGLRGLEPLTSPLSGVRSNQLSYRPLKGWIDKAKLLVSLVYWWRIAGSNR